MPDPMFDERYPWGSTPMIDELVEAFHDPAGRRDCLRHSDEPSDGDMTRARTATHSARVDVVLVRESRDDVARAVWPGWLGGMVPPLRDSRRILYDHHLVMDDAIERVLPTLTIRPSGAWSLACPVS